MATYNTVLRQIALSVNALTGATAATLETTYSTVPLTSANFQSSILSFTSLKDKMLNAEAKIITRAADSGDHPYRQSIISQTNPLAYGDLIPLQDAFAARIIGSYGTVRDSVTSQPCIENELRRIQDRVLNPTIWIIPVFWFAIDDRRIYHTVNSVIMDVCTYNRPVADSLVLTTNIILPDDAVPAYVHGALMECIRDDEFLAQGAQFGSQFTLWLNEIKSGYTSVDPSSSIIQKAA